LQQHLAEQLRQAARLPDTGRQQLLELLLQASEMLRVEIKRI